MAFIYSLTNIVNGKMYVGKTTKPPQIRYNEHIEESKKERSKHRQLYAAIREYGVDNFKFQLIEKCEDDIAPNREQYYINLYNTFENGYNETLGGDGKPTIHHSAALDSYFDYCNISIAAEKLGIDEATMRKIVRESNVKYVSFHQQANPVVCIDCETRKEYIMESITGASKRIYNSKFGKTKFEYNKSEMNQLSGMSSHIRRAIRTNGTAYGFMWRQSSIEEASKYLKAIVFDLNEQERIQLDDSFITIDITGISFDSTGNLVAELDLFELGANF